MLGTQFFRRARGMVVLRSLDFLPSLLSSCASLTGIAIRPARERASQRFQSVLGSRALADVFARHFLHLTPHTLPSPGQGAPGLGLKPQEQALLLFVPAASGAASSSRRKCRRPKGRDERGLKTMEEIMRIFTVSELSSYSNVTLRTLEMRMRIIIFALPEDAPDRRLAITNLWTIRQVLASRHEPTLG